MPKDAWNKARRKKVGQRVMREWRDEERANKDFYIESLDERAEREERELEERINAIHDQVVRNRFAELHTSKFVELVMLELDRREAIQAILGQAIQLATLKESDYFCDPLNCY